ncbi:MAG: molybdate ABC transporter substrate-binding protein [Ktedonobacteraceae bacterium]
MRHRLRPILAIATFCMVLLAACGGTTAATTATPTPAATTLHIFAAASLTESFTAIATKYHQVHPDVTIKFSFDGSQILEQQIANGAPSDVFASADQTNMQKATTAGLVDSAQVFAKNRLVVIVPTGNPGKITTLKDLARKGVKIVIGAATVPAGKYTLQVLDNMAKATDYGPAYESTVKANFVSLETNVKSVVEKVQLGEADAGFVYRTDVTSAVSSKVTVLDIPDNFNVIAQYPIAVTKNATHADAAQAFVQYILSSDGQAILQQYHFLPTSS